MSMRKGVIWSAAYHIQQRPNWRAFLVTLTYAANEQWQAGQLSNFLRCLRKYLKKKGLEFRYVWVQEQTSKGRPHYHVIVWLPEGVEMPFPDSYGWWPHGKSSVVYASHPVYYIAKKASKCDPGKEPARHSKLFGHGGLTGEALDEVRRKRYPEWLRKLLPKGVMARKRKGGGYCLDDTGEIFTSPYRAVNVRGRFMMMTLDVAANYLAARQVAKVEPAGSLPNPSTTLR